MTSWLEPELCVRLALTLVHFLWQGSAIGAAAGLVALCLRRGPAWLRYNVWLAALLVMAACPVVTLVWLGPAPATHVPTAATIAKALQKPADGRPVMAGTESLSSGPALATAADTGPTGKVADARGAQRKSAPQGTVVQSPVPARPAAMPVPVLPVTPRQPEPKGLVALLADAWQQRMQQWQPYAPWVVTGYLMGVAVVLIRLALGLYGGGRLRRQARRATEGDLLAALGRQAKSLRMRFVPAVAWCQRVAVPTVVGVIRPSILLPLSMASGVPVEHVEALLAHELAHIRRYDHIVNIVQRVIEAFLFFHPVVWLVSARVRRERELCCDDCVVWAGSSPVDYAASLVRAAELCNLEPRRILAAAALAAGGHSSQLRHRVLRLLGVASAEPVRVAHGWPSVVVLAVLMLLLTGHHFYSRAMTRPYEGDPALYLTVADAHQANIQVIRTWKGTAVRESLTYPGVPDETSQPSQKYTHYDEFILDAPGNRLRSTSRQDPGDYVSTVVLTGTERRELKGGPGYARQMVVFPRDVPRGGSDFNPMKLLTMPGNHNAQALRSTYRRAMDPHEDQPVASSSQPARKPKGTQSVRREGDQVIITESSEYGSRKTVYDLSKGGNLILVDSDSKYGSESIRATYEKREGAWLPTSLEVTSVRRSEGVALETRVDRTTLTNQAVNAPVADNEFEPAALGIRKGDKITQYFTELGSDRPGATWTCGAAFGRAKEGSSLPSWVARKSGAGDSGRSSAWQAALPGGKSVELLGIGQQKKIDEKYTTWDWWQPDGQLVRTEIYPFKTNTHAAVFRVTASPEVMRAWIVTGSQRMPATIAHRLAGSDLWLVMFNLAVEAERVGFDLELGSGAKELFRVPLEFDLSTREAVINQKGIERVRAELMRDTSESTRSQLNVFHDANLPGDRFAFVADGALRPIGKQSMEKLDDKHAVTHIAGPIDSQVAALAREQLQGQSVSIKPAVAKIQELTPYEAAERDRGLAALAATSQAAEASGTAPAVAQEAEVLPEPSGEPNLVFEKLPAKLAGFYSIQGSPNVVPANPRPSFCRSDNPLLHYTPDGIFPIRLLFDESGGSGTGYDTLYVDFNNNGDYLDDPVYKAEPYSEKGPDGANVIAYFPNVHILRSGKNGWSTHVQVFLEGKPPKCCFIPQTWAVGKIKVGEETIPAALVDTNWNSSVIDRGGVSIKEFGKQAIRADMLALGLTGGERIDEADIGDTSGAVRIYLTEYLMLDSDVYRVRTKQSDKGVWLDLVPAQVPTGQLPLSAKARESRLTLVGTQTAVVLSKPEAVITVPADTYYAPGLDYSSLYIVQAGDVAEAPAERPAARTTGVVLLPTGQPAKDAQVLLRDSSHYAYVENGEALRAGRGLLATAGADGEFAFVPPAEDYVLAVIHESGWAQVSRQEFEADSRLVLKPWAKVEGTLLRNGQPWPGEEIRVFLEGLPGNLNTSVHYSYDVQTDRNGRFTINRFVPVQADISHDISVGGGMHTRDDLVKIEPKPGQTVQVTLGSKNGRPVVGRVTLAGGRPLPPGWMAMASMGTPHQMPEPPKPANWDQMTPEQKQAHVQAWLNSAEGKKAAQAMANQRHYYSFGVKPDGSFRVESVEPGECYIQVDLFDRGPDGNGPRKQAARLLKTVTVPAGAGGTAVDIGTLEAESWPKPPSTQKAPDSQPAASPASTKREPTTVAK